MKQPTLKLISVYIDYNKLVYDYNLATFPLYTNECVYMNINNWLCKVTTENYAKHIARTVSVANFELLAYSSQGKL